MFVRATDTSTITADAGGFAVALILSTSGKFTSVAIGLAAALNTITNSVDAFIAGSTVKASGTLASPFASDGVHVEAVGTPTIKALTIAGAVAANGSLTGAGSGNYVTENARGAIHASTVHADGGALRVLGTSTTRNGAANITADAGGVSIAIQLAQSSGGSDFQANIAIGVGIAINTIKGEVSARVDNSSLVVASGDIQVAATSTASIVALTFGAAVSAVQAGRAGGDRRLPRRRGLVQRDPRPARPRRHRTRFLRDLDRRRGLRHGDGQLHDQGGRRRVPGIAVLLGNQNGVNGAIGIGVAIDQIGGDGGDAATIEAIVDNATISALDRRNRAGDLDADHQRFAIGGALDGQIGDGDGLNITGGGAGARNTVNATVTAAIQNGGAHTVTTTTGAVQVLASEDATLKADAGGFAISFKIGGGDGANLSFGVGVAINTLEDTVQAIVDGTYVEGDSVTVRAGTARSEHAHVAGNGRRGRHPHRHRRRQRPRSRRGRRRQRQHRSPHRPGARAERRTRERARGSRHGRSARQHEDPFRRRRLRISFDLTNGDSSGAAISAGISVSSNDLGDTVTAQVTNSLLDAGSLTVKAAETSTLEALTMGGAGSARVTVGTGVDGDFAVAVVIADNTVHNTVLASIDATPTSVSPRTAAIEVGAGGVDVAALDTVSMTNAYGAGGISVAIGLSEGGASFAGTIGVALGKNIVSDLVDARIQGATVDSGGAVTVEATSNDTFAITAAVVAVSIALQISEVPISVAVVGIGLTAENTLTGHTAATIDGGSVVTAVKDVTVHAKDTSTENSGIGAGGFSLALISATVLVISSTNTIGNDISATIGSGQVTSSGAGVKAWAESTANVARTETGGVAVAISIGGAGANQKATGTIGGSVVASIASGAVVNAALQANSTATSSSNVSVHQWGGDGALGIVGHDSTTTGTISRGTQSFVAQGASITAGSLSVVAEATQAHAVLFVTLGEVGLVGGGSGDTATATVSGDVDAYIGAAQGSTATSASTVIDVTNAVTVEALSDDVNAEAHTDGGSRLGLDRGDSEDSRGRRHRLNPCLRRLSRQSQRCDSRLVPGRLARRRCECSEGRGDGNRPRGLRRARRQRQRPEGRREHDGECENHR